MKIAIIGTGGVGGYFGTRLAQAGNDVRFLARGKHLDVIKKNGLFLKSILGDYHLQNVNAWSEIKDLGVADLVLVAVKSWQVKELAHEINGILHENSIVLPLQNGVLAAEELSESIPSKHILNGICRIFSMVEKAGVIHHKGVKPLIVFGEQDNEKTDRVVGISRLFTNAGIHHKIAADIEAEVWKKFISICLSGLMAVTKTNYGEMRSRPKERQMMFDLLNEVYQLAINKGVNIGEDYVDKAVSFIETFNPDATASLTRDVWSGRPSEIEYQNGTVVRLAKKYGVEVPLNEYVYKTILALEKDIIK